jgi:hypothetical protein
MSLEVICGAIASRNVIQFYYTGTKSPGLRLVEPYMVAYNQKDHLALVAWFLGGESESHLGPGWREYLLPEMAQISVLPTQFAARADYNRNDERFHNIQCTV